MTPIPTELRELLEQICVELEHDNDRYMLGRELRKALATPPADAADMGGQAGEDGERNRAFKACPNSGCDWGAFYLGWKAKAKDLVSIRAALESQHRQQAGKLVEALKTIYDEDYQAPHDSTDGEIKESMKRCIFRIRRIVKDALAAHDKQSGEKKS